MGSAVIFAGMALVQTGKFKPTAQPRVAPVIDAEMVEREDRATA